MLDFQMGVRASVRRRIDEMGCIGGQREHAGDESGDGFFGAEINRAPAHRHRKKVSNNGFIFERNWVYSKNYGDAGG